jgi:hypothetical protein
MKPVKGGCLAEIIPDSLLSAVTWICCVAAASQLLKTDAGTLLYTIRHGINCPLLLCGAIMHKHLLWVYSENQRFLTTIMR